MFIIVWILNLRFMPLFSQALFVLIILTILLYWLNLFHPPAITFAMAYIIFFKGVSGYIFVLFATLLIFISARLVIYIIHEHLDIKNFFKEFIREEEEIIKKEAKRI
jgi:hypothetical protein